MQICGAKCMHLSNIICPGAREGRYTAVQVIEEGPTVAPHNDLRAKGLGKRYNTVQGGCQILVGYVA